jgi:hypothetical protein
MLLEYDIRTIAPAVRHLHANGQAFSPRMLSDISTRLERAGESSTAVAFLEMVSQHPASTPADLESAIFRVGILCESALNDPGRAWQCYQQIVSHWPMGPFADQARARQKVLAARTNS